MSHIVTLKTKLRDPTAIAAACARLELPPPVEGRATLFGGEVTGVLIRLPEWLYPAVIDLPTGEIRYDNYSGAWGDAVHLERFMQIYAVEKAKLEAHQRGYAVSEQALADGSIRVRINEAM